MTIREGGSPLARKPSTAVAPRDLIALRASSGRSVGRDDAFTSTSTRTWRASKPGRLISHVQPTLPPEPPGDATKADATPIRFHFGTDHPWLRPRYTIRPRVR